MTSSKRSAAGAVLLALALAASCGHARHDAAAAAGRTRARPSARSVAPPPPPAPLRDAGGRVFISEPTRAGDDGAPITAIVVWYPRHPNGADGDQARASIDVTLVHPEISVSLCRAGSCAAPAPPLTAAVTTSSSAPGETSQYICTVTLAPGPPNPQGSPNPQGDSGSAPSELTLDLDVAGYTGFVIPVPSHYRLRRVAPLMAAATGFRELNAQFGQNTSSDTNAPRGLFDAFPAPRDLEGLSIEDVARRIAERGLDPMTLPLAVAKAIRLGLDDLAFATVRRPELRAQALGDLLDRELRRAGLFSVEEAGGEGERGAARSR